jgi:hypothetical protein
VLVALVVLVEAAEQLTQLALVLLAIKVEKHRLVHRSLLAVVEAVLVFMLQVLVGSVCITS